MLVRTLLGSHRPGGSHRRGRRPDALHPGDDDRRRRRPDRRGNLPLRRHRPLPLHLRCRRRIGDGAPHPLLIALHGGSGNASQMMRGQPRHHRRRRSAAATSRSSRTACRAASAAPCPASTTTGPSPTTSSSSPSSSAARRRPASSHEDRVHLVGFSGGAALIYDIVATPGLPARDRLGRDRGRRLRPLPRRPPRRRLHRHAASGRHAGQRPAGPGRPRRPPARRRRARPHRARSPTSRSAPRSTTWRLVTGTGAAPAQALDVLGRSTRRRRPTSRPSATPGRARPSSRSLDPALPHAWPDWDVMAVAAELFERE